jgi:peptide/nickel transport system permease protein
MVIVLGTVLAALVGPWLEPYDPVSQDLPLRLAAPSWSHPLGLDELGRDLLARLLAGARVSLSVGCAVVGISALVGVTVGATAGYLGGKTDAVVGRFMDVLLAFPGILLAIALVAVLGPSLRNVVLALVTIGWVGYARLVRGQVLKVRELEFIQAARALGAPLPRVLIRHVIPSTFSAVSVQATLGMAGAIIAEASLSFLGLGVHAQIRKIIKLVGHAFEIANPIAVAIRERTRIDLIKHCGLPPFQIGHHFLYEV